MKKIYSLIGAVLPLLASAFVHGQAVTIKNNPSSDAPQAVVISVNGKCEYSDDGVLFSELKPGHVLNQGAVVRAGESSRTDIFFRRIGTTVRLQAGTDIKLEKMTRITKEGSTVMETLLDLRTGRIFTVVRSLIPGSTLEIRNAAGRSVVEGGGGNGRYIITADGTHVTDKDSLVPLKVFGETGITIITPGQKFNAKEGKPFPLAVAASVEEFINLDEIQSLAEELTPTLAHKFQDDSQALVLAVGDNSTFSKDGTTFEKLKVGQVLLQGAVIRSGDATVIDLFLRRWGTTLRLVSNTELTLEKMTKTPGLDAPILETCVHLKTGRIFCFIRVPVANSKFEVRTLLGRSVINTAGAGRYDIRANGTIVAGLSSYKQLELITENGVTVIAPGQKFNAEDGHLVPAAPSEVELLIIQMDQLGALSEHLSELEFTKRD